MAKTTATKTNAASPAPSPIDLQATEKKNRLRLWIAGGTAFAISLLIYVMRYDRVVGLVVDDAWYVLLAKALATGQGYTLINSPTSGITPFYAPGFPALLSLFYRFSPDFPNNVWLLKSVSIAAMLGAGVLAFRYFTRERELPTFVALGLAFATTIYPAIVFLATSTLMSECVFLLTQLAAIWVIERGVRENKHAPSWHFAALGGLLVGYGFLTRPAGLGLLIGGALYLFKEKLVKQALIFGTVAVLIVGPWTLYSRSHTPTPEQRAEQGANIVQPYTTQFWQHTAGQPLNGTITAGEIPERIWKNLTEIGRFDFGGFVIYPMYRPLEPGEPIRVAEEGRMMSLFFAFLALLGFIIVCRQRMTMIEFVLPFSLGITVLWGWEQFRLLLPLLPFLFFYLVMGVRFLGTLYQKLYDEPKPNAVLVPMLVVSWFLVLTALWGNVQYLNRKYDPVPEYRSRWIAAYDENEAFIKHVRDNVPKQETLATQNPALVHLYTGHKTIASDDPAGQWETWNKLGVRYLVRTSPLPLPKPDAIENRYRILHRTNGLNLRLIDLGAPSSRPVWGK